MLLCEIPNSRLGLDRLRNGNPAFVEQTYLLRAPTIYILSAGGRRGGIGRRARLKIWYP
jgi:hypothetical protein